jgi:hypothetical protein
VRHVLLGNDLQFHLVEHAPQHRLGGAAMRRECLTVKGSLVKIN